MNLREAIDNLIEKILGRKISKSILQYFRYLICGGIATMTDVALLFILVHLLNFHYLFAAAASFLTGMVVNYTLNTILVFKSSGKIRREFSVFAIVGAGGLMWTELIMWILVAKLKFLVMIAKIIAIILVLQWNFFMRKRFVFQEEELSGEKRFFD